MNIITLQTLFLSGVAFIYLVAFMGLSREIIGLNGKKGIYPTHLFLKAIKSKSSCTCYLTGPTLFWIVQSDWALKGAAYLGILISGLTLIGFHSFYFFALLWMLYLSFRNATSISMQFQFDTLLLEVGFFSIFFSISTPPSLIFLFVGWFLIFNLMFTSGLHKIIMGQNHWRRLTAMSYHFETQPFPTIIGYYLHQMPLLFKKMFTAVGLIVEILVPLLIFATQELRFLAGFIIILFQLAIFITGDFAFFNILSAIVALLLFADVPLTAIFESLGREPVWVLVCGILMLCLQIMASMDTFTEKDILSFLRRYRLTGGYSMFSFFSVKHQEVVVEGSYDNKTWKEYEFHGKVRSLNSLLYFPTLFFYSRCTALVGLLSSYKFDSKGWFSHLLIRLLQGSPEVIKLLKKNPFPHLPPKYIRARKEHYQFTDLNAKLRTGNWWVKKHSDYFCTTFYLVERMPEDFRKNTSNLSPLAPFTTIDNPFDPFPI